MEDALHLAIGGAVGLAVFVALRLATRYVLAPHRPRFAESLTRRLAAPSAWFLPVLGVYFALPTAPHAVEAVWPKRVLVTLLLILFGILAVRALHVLEDSLMRRFDMSVADNLRARRFHTQFRVLRQVVGVAIWVLVAAAILMQIEGFRQFGSGLLASAGIAGIVIGLAAQRTLGNLIAGFQIALAQPIRLDDVVIVEGEWGRVEEITLTYVVVAIWDQRRLVVPISYFVTNSVENWTRRTSEILGTVFLHVDYTAPLDAMREELKRLVADHADWDGRVAEIVAFEARATTLEIRALVSARDSGAAWRLRCFVREGLIGYLLREHPGALPRSRVAADAKTAVMAEAAESAAPTSSPAVRR